MMYPKMKQTKAYNFIAKISSLNFNKLSKDLGAQTVNQFIKIDHLRKVVTL